MTRTVRTGAAGLLLVLAVAAGAAPAAATTVTVRVEGSGQPVVRQVAVAPSGQVKVDKGFQPCPGTTAAGALELATGGDWSGQAFSFGQAVDVIRGESHAFGSGAYWAVDVNNTSAPTGVCDYVPQDGDELLFYAACESGPAPGCFSGDPLGVSAPAQVRPGVPFLVHVDEYTSPFGEAPTKANSANATVSGAGLTVGTGADGNAVMTFSQRGPVEIVATKGGRVRDEVSVCLTDGSDGFCGTSQAQPPAHTDPCLSAGDDGLCGSTDTRAPAVRISGLQDKQRFRRSRAPRRIRATVAPDASGIAAVKLGLSRAYRHRCTVLSGRTETFRRSRCGRHPVFRIGDRAAVDYLLPARLRPGRYVLDVVAVDRAGNRDRLARGRNRITFTVK